MFCFPKVSNLIKGFKKLTNNELECEKISGRRFESANEHSEYNKNKGCREVVEWLDFI